MNSLPRFVAALAAVLVLSAGLAYADASGDPAPVKQQPDGQYVDKAGNPTFKIGKDGTVDWFTYVGYLRYGDNCLRCHGPDGLGSSYAPNLTQVLKDISYTKFFGIVAGGIKNVNQANQLVMPSFGTDKNTMCYLNAIYVYLRARSDGALGRNRPEKHEPRTEAYTKEENSCMG